MNIGTLYIVATPIGNLGDMTMRAVETLKNVDVVLCEDTRVTKKLLNHYDIDTKTMSYHQHSGEERMAEVVNMLEDGKNLALVTDAGTPGISDPGNKLVSHVTRSMEHVTIVAVPGVSAVTAALSVSGFATDKFVFMGFPPHKKRRGQFFEEIAASKYTVCFYESCHRIEKCLAQLAEVLDADRQVCVCRELTKKFESVYRGSIAEIAQMDIPAKGEFVIVIRH